MLGKLTKILLVASTVGFIFILLQGWAFQTAVDTSLCNTQNCLKQIQEEVANAPVKP
jgi:hypothetical protein